MSPGELPSRSRVHQAIEALTEDDLVVLDGRARRWIRWLGPRADGKTVEDLIQESFRAALTRAWPPDLSLMPFLIGLMRGIVSNWVRGTKRRGGPMLPGSSIGRDEAPDPVEVAPSRDEEFHRQTACRETLAQLEQLFREDQELLDLIEAFRLGYVEWPDIHDLLGITKTEFDTRKKRMRRNARGHFSNPGERYE